ncbi:MAG: DUF1439 domain-containing protein [Aeromonas sp.]
MLLQSLLLSAALLTPGQTEITEQQINSMLDHQGLVERNVDMPGLFSAKLTLNHGEVQLGRQQEDVARVIGKGDARLAMGNKAPVDAKVAITFDGKPRYDATTHSLYLDDAKVVSYSMEPKEVQAQYGVMLELMLQNLQQRLVNQPIYRLGAQNKQLLWWRQHLTGVDVEPGKLLLLINKG